MFLDLYMQFPGAKVVLTTRPSLEWAKRRKNVHKFTPVPVLRPCGQSWMLEHYTDQTLAAMLDAYHDLVRCVVPPDNLLEIDLFNVPSPGGLTLTHTHFLTGPQDKPGASPFGGTPSLEKETPNRSTSGTPQTASPRKTTP